MTTASKMIGCILCAGLLLLAGGATAGKVVPCGTPDHLRAHRVNPSAAAAVRPPDGTYSKTSTHFRVHYEDALLNGYADTLLQYAEESYTALIDSLGCQVPPSDEFEGGDARTDFYIIPGTSVSFWGRTVPEASKPTGSYPNSWTSYVEIVDTLSAGLLSAVVVHEYFHVIQLGYDKGEDVSFLEMISVWSEEYLYDEVNNYLQYLYVFFVQPQIPLMNWTYNNVPWALFLSQRFGDAIIEDILHRCGLVSGENSETATDDELGVYGSTLMDQFALFTLWNYFTGDRDDGLHYEEGALYPHVWIERDTECLPLESYTTTHRIGREGLGSNFLTFLGDHATQPLELEMTLHPDAEWIIGIHRFIAGSVVSTTHHYPTTSGWDPHTIQVSDWEECDSLLVIPHVIRTVGIYQSYEYFVSVRHASVPPPAEPYVLILDRDDCRRPFDGVMDDFTPADGESYAIAAACEAAAVPYQLRDTIPEDLSLCGAIFVSGAYDADGCNLSPSELLALTGFMDGGGDCYLESARVGSWIDPAVGSPGPEEALFWSYFGVSFLPGQPMSSGNVSAWSTAAAPSAMYGAVSAFPPYQFAYDHMGAPDDFVGSLVPDEGTDTLITDQGGAVRGTVAHGPDESERVCVTLLLGGSTGGDGSSTRGAFIRSILDLFDTIVPALSVTTFDYRRSAGTLFFTGELSGWNGERIILKRLDQAGGQNLVTVSITPHGGSMLLSASDAPGAGTHRYLLLAVAAAEERILWEGEITMPSLGFAVGAITPNPARERFAIEIFSDRPRRAGIEIFDPAGRIVYTERISVTAGGSTVYWNGIDRRGNRLPSGLYFLRVTAGKSIASKKLILMR